MDQEEYQLRTGLIQQARWMNANGLNQGTSGNISVRYHDSLIITPSARAYETLEPEHLAKIHLQQGYGSWQGSFKPSSEWRIHLDILKSRPEINAVVHTHASFATALSMTRRPIPPIHYMIALFGGKDIRCADYATFGTAQLSQLALEALHDRLGCLLANHGMIALGTSLPKAMWLAQELETLAKQYLYALQFGEPILLTDSEIEAARQQFSGYGLQE
ncbi:class II aldolase/adducin family protein [Thiolinea disciformis]|uniref:class II aldolase/adducin family protein n=1 Tax=Thiolinea disciformis TaxID=125614 RepID=UPI00036C6ECC|nr:class II aldolase/adducin family protein [Thiolinea disciformis]